MAPVEIGCILIVALFLVVRSRLDDDTPTLLRRLALVALAGWLGETTCIHLYAYYFYAPGWTLPVGAVPLMIPLIWPMVIRSAHDLARRLARSRVALVAGAIVLADASLMEPIAVQAGLWSWTEPGLFGVPLIGIAGWSFFAVAAVAVFERSDRLPAPRRPWFDLVVVVVAPLATHALILASWWGLFRWIQGTVSPFPVVAAAWALSLALAIAAVRHDAKALVPPSLMWVRVPAALFFFSLLALRGRDLVPLVTYALAFAPPYLALTRFPALKSRPAPLV